MRIAAVLILAIIASCGNPMIKNGDDYYTKGNYEKAYEYYSNALAKEPKLEKDEEFMAKYRKSAEETVALHIRNAGGRDSEEKFEQALQELGVALQIDPANAEANALKKKIERKMMTHKADKSFKTKRYEEAYKLYKEALAAHPNLAEDTTFAEPFRQCGVETSNKYYLMSLAEAGAGKLDECVAYLRKSLDFNPENSDASSALTCAQTEISTVEEADRGYLSAISLMKEKNWVMAQIKFDEAIKLDKNHVHSYIKSYMCNEEIRKADSYFRKAESARDEKILDNALFFLEKTLEVYPFHAKAVTEKKSVFDTRTKASQLNKGGWELLKAKNDQQALENFKQALDVYPYYSLANEGSAVCYFNIARKMEASARITAAIFYYGAVCNALQRVSDSGGDPEKALGGQEQKRIKQLRAIVDEKLLRKVDFSINSAEKTSQDAPQFEQLFIEVLKGTYPVQSVTVQKEKSKADISIVVDLNDFSVKETKSSKQSSKKYVHHVDQKYNSAYDKSKNALDAAQKERDRLSVELEKAQQFYNEADAELSSLQAKQLSYTIAQNYNAANSLIGAIFSAQSNKDKMEDQLNKFRGYYNNACANLERAAANYDKTPQYVENPVYDYWKYSVDTHTKKAALSLTVKIIDSMTKQVLESFTIQESKTKSDTTVADANPSIGIDEDPLDLPDDNIMKEDLYSATTSKIRTTVMRKFRDALCKGWLKQASEFARDGDMDNATDMAFLAQQVVHQSQTESITVIESYLKRIMPALPEQAYLGNVPQVSASWKGAAIKRNDVIAKVQGGEINSGEELAWASRRFFAGEELEFSVRRGGDEELVNARAPFRNSASIEFQPYEFPEPDLPAAFVEQKKGDVAPMIGVLAPATNPFTTDQGSIEVRAKVWDDIGLAEVSVYVNGRLQEGFKGIHRVERETERNETRPMQDVNVKVDLPEKENVIKIVAVDTQGLHTETVIRVIKRVEEVQGTIFVLAVGISSYSDSKISPLKYAKDDAIAFHKFFAEAADSPALKENTKLLTDSKATAREIKKAFDWLAQKAVNPNDVVIFYYSGHGDLVPHPTLGSAYYLVPHDAEVDSLSATCLGMDEVRTLWTAIKAKTRIMILDSCYAGNFTKVGGAGEGIDSKIGGDSIVFTAAKAGQRAAESNKYNMSLFTHCLLAGMKDREADGALGEKDGKVTLKELGKYLEERVSALAKEEQVVQTPVIRNDSDQDFVLIK